MTDERRCEWPPCGKPLKGKRRGAKFHSYECKSNWLAARARARRHEEAEADGRRLRQSERSPDGKCLLPGCGKKLTGKRTRFCAIEHGITYRDARRPPKIDPEERARRIEGARCALEECGQPVPPERASRALRSDLTRFFCKPEHRERYWTRHGERKNKRIDAYAVLRALVPGSKATPFSVEAKEAIVRAEGVLRELRAALARSDEAFAAEVERGYDPKKLTHAREAYHRGSVGLRGGGRLLGVTAPTFVDLLRRLGDEIRPQGSAPSGATVGSRAAATPKPRAHEGLHGAGGPRATVGSAAAPRPSARNPSGRSSPNDIGRIRPPAHRAPSTPDADEDHEARRRIADMLAGNLKLPSKAVGAIGAEADQAEWERCRSWRRMLIGIQWAKADPLPTLRAFVADARTRANGTTPRPLLDADSWFKNGTRSMESYLRLCTLAVDGLQVLLPSRSALDAEIALCDAFRTKFPTAPKGFSSVGH